MAFPPLSAYIPASHPASTMYPMDGALQGPGSMLTHSNTEAFEKVVDGGYVPRDQCGSAALQS